MHKAGSEAIRALPGMSDTIVAIATAPGRGAVAIVRLSGSSAIELAARHITPRPSKANEVYLADVRDAEGNLLDRALVSTFLAPHSFTGEDVVEVSSHGGHVVPQSIVATFIASGARQAQPGEFTRRAVANGKIDMVQAEAIADLVDARSRAMQKSALSQLDGALSRRINFLRESILQLEAFLAYDIDFPEEDDGPISREKITQQATETIRSLHTLISTGAAGELVREGAVVVIAGPPNVGKSSLFNALLGHARAIVTEIPGTTRDALEAVVDAGDFAIRLVDTAGLRESEDYVEQLGIEVSRKYLAAADVVLACSDSEAGLPETVSALGSVTSARIIPVQTKVDLLANSYNVAAKAFEAIGISTLSGAGVELLLERIQTVLEQENPVAEDTPLLTRARHLAAVTLAANELEEFLTAWNTEKIPATVAAIHVRSAANALEELIGAVDVEHVLDVVFSSFCVGK